MNKKFIVYGILFVVGCFIICYILVSIFKSNVINLEYNNDFGKIVSIPTNINDTYIINDLGKVYEVNASKIDSNEKDIFSLINELSTESIIEASINNTNSMFLNDRNEVYIAMENEMFDEIFFGRIIGINYIQQVDSNEKFSVLLSDEGEVYIWDNYSDIEIIDNAYYQINSMSLLDIENKIVKFAMGNNYILALDDEGKVWSCGENSYGQLGVGSFETLREPQRIQFNETVKDICADQFTSMLLTKSGDVYSWGIKEASLGIGDLYDVDTSVPVKISKLKDISSIKCNNSTAVALDKYGKLYLWGNKYKKSKKVKEIPSYFEPFKIFDSTEINFFYPTTLGVIIQQNDGCIIIVKG